MKWLLLVDLVLSRQVVLMVAMQVVVLVIQLVFVLDLVWMVFHGAVVLEALVQRSHRDHSFDTSATPH